MEDGEDERDQRDQDFPDTGILSLGQIENDAFDLPEDDAFVIPDLEEGSGSAPRTPCEALDELSNDLANQLQWGFMNVNVNVPSIPKTSGAQRRMSLDDVREDLNLPTALADPGLSTSTKGQNKKKMGGARFGNFEDEFALALTRRMEKVQEFDDLDEDAEAIEHFGDLPSFTDVRDGLRTGDRMLGGGKALRRGTIMGGRDRCADFGLLKARRKSNGNGLVSGTTTPRGSCQSPQSQSRRGSTRSTSSGGGRDAPRSILGLLRRGDASVAVSLVGTPTRCNSLKGTTATPRCTSAESGASSQRAQASYLAESFRLGSARSAAGRYPSHRSANLSQNPYHSNELCQGGHRPHTPSASEEITEHGFSLPTSLPTFRSKRPQHRGFYFDDLLSTTTAMATSWQPSRPPTSGSLSEPYSMSASSAIM